MWFVRNSGSLRGHYMPVAWQGWAVLSASGLLLAGIIFGLGSHHPFLCMAGVFVVAVVMLVVTRLTSVDRSRWP